MSFSRAELKRLVAPVAAALAMLAAGVWITTLAEGSLRAAQRSLCLLYTSPSPRD